MGATRWHPALPHQRTTFPLFRENFLASTVACKPKFRLAEETRASTLSKQTQVHNHSAQHTDSSTSKLTYIKKLPTSLFKRVRRRATESGRTRSCLLTRQTLRRHTSTLTNRLAGNCLCIHVHILMKINVHYLRSDCMMFVFIIPQCTRIIHSTAHKHTL